MSPYTLARLQRVARLTRRLAHSTLDPMGAVYPRDFHDALTLARKGWYS